MPPILDLTDVSVSLGGTPIVHEVSCTVEAGEWVGLLGPNGSGKTTLLRAIGAHVPFKGTIHLNGRPVSDWSPRERARQLAVVRQAPSVAFDFTVEELVLLGRAPHTGWFQSYAADDRDRVARALQQVDLQGFGPRPVLSLSGGELQRVFLAQALVQDADLLLLDEPTAHLDVHYQYAFMDRVAELVEAGRTIFAVFHDLELAARYADRLVVLHRGRRVADGPPAEVLTPQRIGDVFRMHAAVHVPDDGPLRIDYCEPMSEAAGRGE